MATELLNSDVEESFAALGPAGIEPGNWDQFVAAVEDGKTTDPDEITVFLQRAGKTPADLTAGRERLQKRRVLKKLVDSIPGLHREAKAAAIAVNDADAAARLAAEAVMAKHHAPVRAGQREQHRIAAALHAAEQARRELTATASKHAKVRRDQAGEGVRIASHKLGSAQRVVNPLEAEVRRYEKRLDEIGRRSPTAAAEQDETAAELGGAKARLQRAREAAAAAEQGVEAAQAERQAANAALCEP